MLTRDALSYWLVLSYPETFAKHEVDSTAEELSLVFSFVYWLIVHPRKQKKAITTISAVFNFCKDTTAHPGLPVYLGSSGF